MYYTIRGRRIIGRFNSFGRAKAYADEHAANVKRAENIRIIRAVQRIIAIALFILAIVSPKLFYGEGSFLLLMVPVSGYFFFTHDLWLLEIFGKKGE